MLREQKMQNVFACVWVLGDKMTNHYKSDYDLKVILKYS